jgi:hypothetical protein
MVTKIYFFFTEKEFIAKGYDRIVFGGRGPYIELDEINISENNIYIPDDCLWRIYNDKAYYVEYRTKLANVKIYYQLKTVDYADYLIGKFYISPFDLFLENKVKIIERLKK